MNQLINHSTTDLQNQIKFYKLTQSKTDDVFKSILVIHNNISNMQHNNKKSENVVKKYIENNTKSHNKNNNKFNFLFILLYSVIIGHYILVDDFNLFLNYYHENFIGAIIFNIFAIIVGLSFGMYLHITILKIYKVICEFLKQSFYYLKNKRLESEHDNECKKFNQLINNSNSNSNIHNILLLRMDLLSYNNEQTKNSLIYFLDYLIYNQIYQINTKNYIDFKKIKFINNCENYLFNKQLLMNNGLTVDEVDDFLTKELNLTINPKQKIIEWLITQLQKEVIVNNLTNEQLLYIVKEINLTEKINFDIPLNEFINHFLHKKIQSLDHVKIEFNCIKKNITTNILLSDYLNNPTQLENRLFVINQSLNNIQHKLTEYPNLNLVNMLINYFNSNKELTVNNMIDFYIYQNNEDIVLTFNYHFDENNKFNFDKIITNIKHNIDNVQSFLQNVIIENVKSSLRKIS